MTALRLLLPLLLVTTRLSAAPADSASLLRAAAEAESRHDTGAALALLLRAEPLLPDDPSLLQRLSRHHSDATVDAAGPAERKRLTATALDYARRATALRPDDPVNQLSLAICYAKLGLYSDARTKVAYSRLVKSHAERALALSPDYDYAHHVLGRWHYEVAELGAAKRWLVALIYGRLPEASTAEAVRHLRRAVELAPATLAHRVELGYALLADGQPAAATEILRTALALPDREKHDPESRRRAHAALSRLG